MRCAKPEGHRRGQEAAALFSPPATDRFAVKVINHFGDEVMKVFGVGEG